MNKLDASQILNAGFLRSCVLFVIRNRPCDSFC